MGREGRRDQGLDKLKFFNLGSHLPKLEEHGGEEEREHWTKTGGHKLVASGPEAYLFG